MSYRHKMKELTDNIRKHRELLGYSQGKMAELLDVSRPFYCQVETGKRILSLKRLIQISDIFNVTLDVLTKPRTVVAPDPTDQSENQTDQSENTLNEILNTYGNRGFEANKTKKEPPDEQDQEHRETIANLPHTGEDGERKSYTESPPTRHHSSVRRTKHSSWTYHPNVTSGGR